MGPAKPHEWVERPITVSDPDTDMGMAPDRDAAHPVPQRSALANMAPTGSSVKARPPAPVGTSPERLFANIFEICLTSQSQSITFPERLGGCPWFALKH